MLGFFSSRKRTITRSAHAIRTAQHKRHTVVRRISGVFLLAGLVISSTLLPLSHALPGDYTWTKANMNLAGDQMNWASIASSSDGIKLAAVASSSSVYTSADSGATWVERIVPNSRQLRSIASSTDGTKLAVVEGYTDFSTGTMEGAIYTSSDTGATWTQRSSAGSHYWWSITSSADGAKLAAVAGGYSDTGYIYTSIDSGATWTERTAAGQRHWWSIASSTDGTKLAATASYDGDHMYTSADSGGTWTQQTAVPNQYASWRYIASSADGTKLVATDETSIFTSSDAGVTWAQNTPDGTHSWSNIASSADGTKLAATATSEDTIYTSDDAGLTWTQRAGTGLRNWVPIASSSDGSKLIIGEGNQGSLYTSTDSGATWAQRTVIGGRAWSSIASSADGTKLAATERHYDYDTGSQGGSIYTSSDSGTTWTERIGAGSHDWYSIASSADSTKLVATADSGVYTSTDSGLTWIERTEGLPVASDHTTLLSVVSSADGSKLALVNQYYDTDTWDLIGSVYTSSDSGATWTERTNAGLHYWQSITSSADGTKLAAVEQHADSDTGDQIGSIYTSSDSGVTWTERTSAGLHDWQSIASSADGTKLVATAGGYYDTGYIYTSTNSGVTWTERTVAGLSKWGPVASSDDGTQLAVINYNHFIYTSINSGLTWVEQTSAGLHQWSSIVVTNDGNKLAATVNGGNINMNFASMEGPATATHNYSSNTAPAGTTTTVAQSTLSATSSTCYVIDTNSTSVLSPSSVASPDQNVALLGGIAYSVTCATQGGSTKATITLGSVYTDIAKLRIYKKMTISNTLEDITNQVTLANQTTNGITKTVLTYTLIDGGDFDEDGIVNGVIVDPIYIGVVNTSSASTGTLAATGANLWLLIGGALMLLGVGLAVLGKGFLRA